MVAAVQVVVGLGNPGPEYQGSRHNVGHVVVDRLAHSLDGRFVRRGPAHVAAVSAGGSRLYLAKLRAYMNESGPSLAWLLDLLDVDPSAVVLVYDDLDLPFGQVRVRRAGRHGGHNGVRSVIATLGTQAIRRVKVGIGRPASRDPDTVADWVLTPFDPEERAALPAIVDEAATAALGLLEAPDGPAARTDAGA